MCCYLLIAYLNCLWFAAGRQALSEFAQCARYLAGSTLLLFPEQQHVVQTYFKKVFRTEVCAWYIDLCPSRNGVQWEGVTGVLSSCAQRTEVGHRCKRRGGQMDSALLPIQLVHPLSSMS